MKYEKEKEHKKLAPYIRYVDVFGNVISGCVELDTETKLKQREPLLG